MNDERIETALQEATDTRTVTIGAGKLASVADIFEESFGDSEAVIVADENTFEVAGKEVQRQLEEAGHKLVEPYVFPGEPALYAGYGNIETLVEALREHDAIPIAVGSGTLNDIVKRSSYECERPYMCVGTAASMDGYTAFGASIEKDGHKQTLTCPAPRAVLADVDILVGAPAWMTASGYADLLGKVTSGADWLVADALEVEKIDPKGWSLVQDHLRGWIGEPCRVAGRRRGGYGSAHRGPGHVRAGDAVLPVFPYRLGRRAPVQPPVGERRAWAATTILRSPTGSRSVWGRSPSPHSTNGFSIATSVTWTSRPFAPPGLPGKSWREK